MTNKNEVATQQNENTLVELVEETKDFNVYKNAEGKFIRKAKFEDYSSVQPKTREEKIWLMNLIENEDEAGFGMKESVGQEIEVQDIIFRKYDKVDEDTGELVYGVLTYLITPERKAFVTSSKSVYFTVKNIMKMFGRPDDEEWVNIKVKIGKEKMTNGDGIKIKMIG
jgi:hypothetical protein